MTEHIRSVLVTGGTGSIGRAIIAQFARNGYKVRFQYRAAVETASGISSETGAIPIVGDLFDTNWLKDVEKPDILVSCAGINISSLETHEVTDEDWARTLQINLTAPFTMARWVLPSMIQKRFGRIIHIGSIFSVRGSTLNAPYNASKHALSGLTKTIAREYARYGITCNEILPGPVSSELMDRLAQAKGAKDGTTPSEYIAKLVVGIPTRRMAMPSEIAAAAAFLASPEAAQINGTSLVIDGGAIS